MPNKKHTRRLPSFKNVKVKIYSCQEREFQWFVLPRTHVAHLLKRSHGRMGKTYRNLFWCGKEVKHDRIRFPRKAEDVVCAECRKAARDYQLNPVIFP